MCIYGTHIYIHTCVCIYIYRERERQIHIIYIYIYVYIYIYILIVGCRSAAWSAAWPSALAGPVATLQARSAHTGRSVGRQDSSGGVEARSGTVWGMRG